MASWSTAAADKAAALCARFTRDDLEARFERRLASAEAQAVAASGAVRCRWLLGEPAVGQGEIVLTLDTELMESLRAARQSILLARLPEEHRGRVVEPLIGVGNGGNMRSVVVEGVTRDLEFEAVEGRRRFVLSVTPRPGPAVSPRLRAQAHEFMRFAVNSGRLGE